MQYSDVAALQKKNGADRVMTTELHGRVRVCIIDTKFTAAEKDVLLVRFPAGRIRILGTSQISATLATSATTIKVGYGAYKDPVFVDVVADDDALLAATAASSLATGKSLGAAGPSGLLIESAEGVDITATLSANGAVNDTITGVIFYVVD